MGTNAYRMDNRTTEEFIRDIELGNEREQRAIEMFKGFLRNEFDFTGTIEDNGCDMTGGFIEDIEKVTSGADFVVGVNRLPLEVKTSAGHITTMYLKTRQIRSYIRQGASVLYVNGIERKRPAFTFFTVDDLKRIEQECEIVIPPNNINGGKESYKLDARQLDWMTFNGRVKRYV